MTPLGGYRRGTSWLHRTPAGAKLAGLLVGSAALVAWGGWPSAAVVSAACLVAAAAAGVPVRHIARTVAPFVVMAVLVVAAQAVLGHVADGVIAATRMTALASAASLLLFTTSPAQLVAAAEGALHRLRVRPDRVFRFGLLVGVSLRSIGYLGVAAQRVRDARRARGLSRSVRAFAVPTVIAAARFAHGAGEAMEARGIGDPALYADAEVDAAAAPSSSAR